MLEQVQMEQQELTLIQQLQIHQPHLEKKEKITLETEVVEELEDTAQADAPSEADGAARRKDTNPHTSIDPPKRHPVLDQHQRQGLGVIRLTGIQLQHIVHRDIPRCRLRPEDNHRRGVTSLVNLDLIRTPDITPLISAQHLDRLLPLPKLNPADRPINESCPDRLSL